MRKLQPRELGLLAVLGGAVLLYLWYKSGSPAGGAPQGAVAARGVAAGAEAPRVLVELLRRDATPYDPRGRNLFQYAQRPPSPEELEAQRRQREEEERRRREAEEARRRAAEQAAQQAAQQQAQTPPPRPVAPQPPPIPFKYIGYFGPKDDKIAAFIDGEEVLLARAGEALRDQFQVVEIRFDTVVIGYTDPRWKDRTREIGLR